MGVTLDVVEDLREATLLVTSKKYYRQKPQKIRDAESSNIPIYVLKGGTGANQAAFKFSLPYRAKRIGTPGTPGRFF